MSDHRPINLVEIWQNQSYWPIKGWTAGSMGSITHFTGSLAVLPLGCETFPENLPAPHGWEWCDKWMIDNSNKHGQSDQEGWYYAVSFDRLNDSIKTNTASGVASKTCLVRKRRWVRNAVCISEELLAQIRARSEKIIENRSRIETLLKEKENILKSVKFYEENRSFVYNQSLHLATQGTLNTLSLLKDVYGKLKQLKLYVNERSQLESEYAKKLEQLGFKFNHSMDESKIDLNEDEANTSAAVTETAPRQGRLKSILSTISNKRSSSITGNTVDKSNNNAFDEMTSPLPGTNPQQQTEIKYDASHLFFSGVSYISKVVSCKISDFSAILTNQLLEDVDLMLADVHHVLKESRSVFRKNSDICRLSESAVRNCFFSVQYAYDSVLASSLEDISKLSDEINAIKGGESSGNSGILGQNPSTTSSSQQSLQREDLWLSIQRYRQVVRDSQEALCVLISESMDLELQQQIIANKVHMLFIATTKLFSHEQNNLNTSIDRIYDTILTDAITNMIAMGPPNPILQSPFAKLQPHHLPDTPKKENNSNNQFNKSNSSDSNDESNNKNNNANEKSILSSTSSSTEYEDFVNSVGVFSFTALYKAPLPVCPSIIYSGMLMWAKESEYKKSKNVLFGGIWKTVYTVATTDGYIHLIGGHKYDIPEKSYYLKHCDVVSLQKDSTNEEYYQFIFEIKQTTTTQQQQQQQQSSTTVDSKSANSKKFEGIFLKAETTDIAFKWVEILNDICPVTYVDSEIEYETTQAMLQSLPILKGETAKINLEFKKYEEMSQLSIQQSSSTTLNVNIDAPQQHLQHQHQGIEHNEAQISNNDNNSTIQHNLINANAGTAHKKDEYNFDLVTASHNFELDDSDDDDGDNNNNTTNNNSNQANDNNNNSNTQGDNKFTNLRSKFNRPNRNSNVTLDDNDEGIRYMNNPMSAGGSNNTTSTKPKSIYGFGSQYKKGADSWIKKTEYSEPVNYVNADLASKTAPIKPPPQIIPVHDGQTPLATRHSSMISQYEQGLQEDKEKATLKVVETKGKRIEDFKSAVIQEANASNEKVPLVKRISQKYNNKLATTGTGSGDSANNNNNKSPSPTPMTSKSPESDKLDQKKLNNAESSDYGDNYQSNEHIIPANETTTIGHDVNNIRQDDSNELSD